MAQAKPTIRDDNLILDIRYEYIGLEEAKILADTIKLPNCNFTTLTLRNNRLGSEGVKAIAEALKSPHCQITSLDLTDNIIGPEGTRELAEALKSPHCKLTKLNLANNNIGPDGAKIIAEALLFPDCKLTYLSLSLNKIDLEGAKTIAKSLKSLHCKLTSLDLSWNRISKQGVEAIAEALGSADCKLTSLDLICNLGTDSPIIDVLKNNTTLIDYPVINNGISNHDLCNRNILLQKARSIIEDDQKLPNLISEISGLYIDLSNIAAGYLPADDILVRLRENSRIDEELAKLLANGPAVNAFREFINDPQRKQFSSWVERVSCSLSPMEGIILT